MGAEDQRQQKKLPEIPAATIQPPRAHGELAGKFKGVLTGQALRSGGVYGSQVAKEQLLVSS